ncbi:MAG: HAD family hydrolase [Thermoplasmata archaeon]|nr:HAD family hydrolase [Candidatus Sysuiplasma jiujiangense]
MTGKAVFIDRDGTIIADCPYCKSKDQVRVIPASAEGIRMLNRLGVLVIVLTNQSGIGRGYFTVDQMNEVNDEMTRQLREYGAEIDAIFHCPHKPEDGCGCRKPETGLIERARREFHTEDEFVIGDRDDVDGELARRAHLRYSIVGDRTVKDIVTEYLKPA